MISSANFPPPGTEVGGGRWPQDSFHPDCWGTPHKGVILHLDDIAAWRGTIAFPRVPTQEQATVHVLDCVYRESMDDRVPVLWTSSIDGEQWVCWEGHICPYAEDVEKWESARSAAYERESKTPTCEV